MTDTTGKSLKEIYDQIEDPNKVTYQSWLRKLHRFAEGNVRTTRRIQRTLGVKTPPTNKDRYLQPFLTYDGEGWDDKYVLLANSLGERIVNKDGLPTVDCLEFLTRRYKDRYKRVWFSFSYDVNHILRDVPDKDLLEIMNGKTIEYDKYRVSYVPGKIFTVNNYRYYDTFSFFQRNFLRVVQLMLGDDRISESLKEGKLARGTFETWNIEQLAAYNDEELALLVEIMDKLRQSLLDINVRINEWYGPGAIAKYWFKAYNVTPPTIPANERLYRALQSTYYGGRFEQIQLGKIKNVYQYDIRSAYPAVMSTMPYFKSWRNVKRFVPEAEYSIWYVRFNLKPIAFNPRGGFKGALPLPVRSITGHLCFPLVGKGWYWKHEIDLIRDFFPKAQLTIHEGYIATTEGTPFAWVKGLYDYRQELKSQGQLSEYAIKIGLNSLYGKTAQRVGSNTYHSLAWAGFITSSTRVKIARAAYSTHPDNVIGFATDAVFTTKRLDLPISTNLGDWDETYYSSGIFFQSGIYRLFKENGEATDKYRGSPFRKGIDQIIAQLERNPSKYPSIKIGRFISTLLAIKAPKAYGPYRRKFVDVNHTLQIDIPYKRHYDFMQSQNFAKGTIRYNYRKLLRQPIPSLPKIWVNDNNTLAWDRDDRILYDEDIESVPATNKDYQLERLLADGRFAFKDSAFNSTEREEVLPVVEDTAILDD